MVLTYEEIIEDMKFTQMINLTKEKLDRYYARQEKKRELFFKRVV